ncbi:MAG: aminoglycoside phosphotransferase family protein [bacterium]
MGQEITAEREQTEKRELTKVFKKKGLGQINILTRLTNGEYDRVYRIDRVNDLPLILKIFRNKDEPNREGFGIINTRLVEKGIPTADVLLVEPSSEVFPTGFMVTSFIEGIDVQDAIKKGEKEGGTEYPEYYKKLGALMKQVHSITFPKFGFVGGTEYSTYVEYMKERLAISFEWTRPLNIFTAEDKISISNHVLSELENWSRLPAVLTHGDISPNNCRLNSKNEPVLIDWGDGLSSQIWLYDFSVMTYWMHWIHESQLGDAEKYRTIFLKDYGKEDLKDSIRSVENAIHLYYAIGLFSYYKEDDKENEDDEKPNKYEKTVIRFKELIANAKLELPAYFK